MKLKKRRLQKKVNPILMKDPNVVLLESLDREKYF